MEISICRDYSQVTGLRHCSISDFSGEDFYHTKLNGAFASAYQAGKKLILVLDGTLDGYSPSFIDEIIGNLVYDFSLDIVKRYLTIVSETDARWNKLILEKTYPLWEERRKKNDEPKITERHAPWYRLVNKDLKKNIWITKVQH